MSVEHCPHRFQQSLQADRRCMTALSQIAACSSAALERYIEPVGRLRGAGEHSDTHVYAASTDASLGIATAEFVRAQYWQVHGARLDHLMPMHFAITDAAQQPLAAIGVRPFDDQHSMVEQYLDVAIEEAAGAAMGCVIERSATIEVGNLAATHLIYGCRLIAFLLHRLSTDGYQTAVCTGTDAVRLALKRARVPFCVIGEADPDRLGAEQARWGTYYARNPQVLAIDISAGLAAIADRYRVSIATATRTLESVV